MDASSQPSAGSASQTVGNMSAADLVQAIAQAVQAAVTTASASLVKQQSVNDDRGFSTEVTGAHDIYDTMNRHEAARDRIQAYAELALAKAVENSDALAKRSLDHFGSLPPVSAKPSGC